jgi:hypothetical protein
MPAGVETRDTAGNVVLTLGDRLSRILGSFNTGTVSGSLVDAGLASGTPWACCIGYGSASTSSSTIPPVVTFSGTTLSWTAPSVDNLVLYGVY